jgi:hypothetical protein
VLGSPLSGLESSPQRSAAADRRPFHDHKAGALQVTHDPLRSYRGHVLVGLMDALAAFEPQGEGDRIGEVFRIGWGELVVGVGHDRKIAER